MLRESLGVNETLAHAIGNHAMKITATIGAVAAVFTTVTADAGVLDQNNPINPLYTSLTNNFEYQQQVTAGIGGTLAGIELYSVASPATSDVVSILVGGSTLFSGTETLAASGSSPFYTGTFIDTSSAGITLTSGESFIIDVVGSGTGALGASTTTYSGGALSEIVSGTTIAPPPGINSLAFQTYVTTVPLPPGLPLLLSGLAGLGLIARRRAAA